MRSFIFIFILLSSVSSLLGETEFRKIMSVKERRELLKIGEIFTSSEGFFYQKNVDFDKLPNLFSFAKEAEKKIETTVKDSIQQAGSTSLIDILKEIAKEVKPSGVVVHGKVKAIFFGNKFLHEGGSLNVNYYGKTYTVVLKSVGKNSFTLKLEDVVVKQPLEVYSTPQESNKTPPSAASPEAPPVNSQPLSSEKK